MANKKISELESRASLSLSDLMAVGDPSTGYLYKTTISDLKTLTGAGVVSFNGRFGTVNPAEGDYTLTQLGDVIITSPSNGQVLKYNGSNWVNATEVAEADTLDTVTGRGNTTSNSITVGSVTAAGLSNLLGQIRTFATTGNTYIGASPVSATDAGYKLDINGTLRVQGRIVTGLGGIVNNCLYTYIGNHCGSSGFLGFGFVNTGDPGLGDSVLDIYQMPSSSPSYPLFNFKHIAADSTGGSGALNIIAVTTTVNQTSGSNGVVRGFYYNPTLTSINGSHFAFESTSGKIKVSDLSGSGSRMVVADANGVLSTQAIPSTTGFVTLDTTQTITALKTFTNVVTFNQNIVGGLIKLSQGVLLSKSANIGSDPGFLSLIATSSTGLNTINLADGDNTSFTQKLVVPNTGNYTYTFPSSSGTLALASDIPSLTNYVTLDGTQTITGAKTFSTLMTAQHIKANYYGFPDSNGYSTGFESTSNNTIQVKIGSGLAINIASNNNATFYGNIIRNGGTSSQFLKADGSLDSSTYATTSSLSSYLPLSGGTLTGALNGTSATFSGQLVLNASNNQVRSGNELRFYRSDNAAYTEMYDAGSLAANGFILNNTNGEGFHFKNGSTTIMRMNSSGNVGINTTNPNSTLHVAGTFRTVLQSGAGGQTLLSAISGVTNGYEILVDTSNNITHTWNTGANVAAMRITPGGLILIGTTSTSGVDKFRVNNDGTTSYSTVNITNTNSTANMYVGVGGSNVANSNLRNNAYVWNASASDLIFGTSDTERMRITSGGDIGIGISSPGTMLHIQAASRSYGLLRITSTTGSTGEASINFGRSDQAIDNRWTVGQGTAAVGDTFGFYTAGSNKATLTTAGVWSTIGGGTSDLRTKQDIEYNFDNGIESVLKLQPTKFKFKNAPDKQRRGFIAQDVLQVIPDLVLGDGQLKDGTYGLDYDGILALAVKAIQEQQVQIEQLKTK